MKTRIDKATSRGHANHGWLNSYHTFSFADYYNPERMGFGTLRVLNDDKVAPGEGFDTHPHKNMEIVSIPLKGHLSHGDSTKNQRVITVGDIQVMSAGTGIFHSEKNDNNQESVEFLQIWILPKQTNTIPKYNDYNIRNEIKKNELSLIISPTGDTPASLGQDAWFSLGKLDKGTSVDYNLHRQDTGVYIFIIEGEIQIEDIILSRRDGIGIYEIDHLHINTLVESQILLMEIPM